MGLFDLFTGKPAIEAAGQQRGVYQGATNQIGNLADITRRYNEDILRGGFSGAREDLGQGYGAATGAVNTGATGALGYLDQGQAGARDALAGARNDLTANGGAYAPLSALAGRYGQGAGLYADALGINGAGGTTRAQDAFTTGPGYNFMVDQGIDAINRKRNAAGSLTGGNADRDAQLFGMGTAKQEYGGWLDRLAAFNPLELSATSGAAAGNAGINNTLAGLGVTGANLANTGGQNRAAIATGQGGSLADIANRYYAGQAGLDTGEAGALSGNMWQGTTPQIAAQMDFAPRQAQTYKDAAQASLQGQQNLLDLGVKAATAAAGMPSGTFTGGNSFLPSSSFMNNNWGW